MSQIDLRLVERHIATEQRKTLARRNGVLNYMLSIIPGDIQLGPCTIEPYDNGYVRILVVRAELLVSVINAITIHRAMRGQRPFNWITEQRPEGGTVWIEHVATVGGHKVMLYSSNE